MKIYGIEMKEKILKIEKSKLKQKKYTAYVQDLKNNKIRLIHFGADGYEQFKDSTDKGYYTKNNHGDPRRRRNYFSRHSSGIQTKKEAIIYEIKKNNKYFNSKILSHKYLW
tara:strand:+ start:3513 stop:3845 length:333 start_codon:yes stop_codon:yes gene_type:complete